MSVIVTGLHPQTIEIFTKLKIDITFEGVLL